MNRTSIANSPTASLLLEVDSPHCAHEQHCTPSIGFDHSLVALTFWTGRLWTPLFQHHKAGPVVPGFGASLSCVWGVLRAGRGLSGTLVLLVACAKEHRAASLSLGKTLSKRGQGRRGMNYLGPDCELSQSYLAVCSHSHPWLKVGLKRWYDS